jgi:hypothetical protein
MVMGESFRFSLFSNRRTATAQFAENKDLGRVRGRIRGILERGRAVSVRDRATNVAVFRGDYARSRYLCLWCSRLLS